MTDPFQVLLDALANQTISDEQFAQLERLIGEDAALRKRFLDFQNLIGNLEEDSLQDETLQSEPSRQTAHESEVVLSWRQRLGRIEHAAVAALLLLCLGLGFLLWKSPKPGSEGITDPPQASSGKAETIATLTTLCGVRPTGLLERRAKGLIKAGCNSTPVLSKSHSARAQQCVSRAPRCSGSILRCVDSWSMAPLPCMRLRRRATLLWVLRRWRSSIWARASR